MPVRCSFSKKGTEQVITHVGYRYKDFPAAESGSGKESTLLGVQQLLHSGTGHWDNTRKNGACRAHSASCLLLTPGLFHRPVSLPWQVTGVEA